MGLLNLFKKKNKLCPIYQEKDEKETIPEEEKKYYQPDSYYTDVAFEGTSFEKRVITFEERKKTAIPSRRGLYPAEILLLEYCLKGDYPGPKNGYPGFWWFTYGIRDVGAVLKTLEDRGYITFGTVKDSVKSFTVKQLKELLAAEGKSTVGKKADLVARVVEVVPEEEILAAGVQLKYTLTEIGQQELDENLYVPYMHSTSNKTTEDNRCTMTFNVWSINKLLGAGDKTNWKVIVKEQERKMKEEIADKNEIFMKELKKIDPKSYHAIRTQDQQIAAVQKAKNKYLQDKDLDTYISFWEMIWKNGGLKFEGVGWYFELPDLYIKAKRFDDALAFVTELKRTKPIYSYKCDSYIEKIEKLKAE